MLTLHGKTRGSGPDDSLAFSPDGYRLFTSPTERGRDAEMQVWDATPMPDEPAADRHNYHDASRWITLDGDAPVPIGRCDPLP